MWLAWSLTRAVATTKSCSSSSIRQRSTSMTTSPWNLAANPPLPHRTPLYSRHVALGGRMVDFGGWELPQQYTSIRDEHFAGRKAAALFDISHIGGRAVSHLTDRLYRRGRIRAVHRVWSRRRGVGRDPRRGQERRRAAGRSRRARGDAARGRPAPLWKRHG